MDKQRYKIFYCQILFGIFCLKQNKKKPKILLYKNVLLREKINCVEVICRAQGVQKSPGSVMYRQQKKFTSHTYYYSAVCLVQSVRVEIGAATAFEKKFVCELFCTFCHETVGQTGGVHSVLGLYWCGYSRKKK